MIDNLAITNDGVAAKNPAFDITPNKFITGFITEFGVIKPSEISEVQNKNRTRTMIGSL